MPRSSPVMRPILLPVPALLALLGLAAAGDAPAPVEPPVQAEPVEAGIGIDEAMAGVPDAVQDLVGWRWGGGADGFAVLAADRDGFSVATPAGAVRVLRSIALDSGAAPRSALASLVRLAVAAGIAADAADLPSGLVLERGILAGLRLRSATHLVLEDGVLTRQDLRPTGRDAETAAVRAAAAQFAAALPTELGDLARRSLRAHLARLDGGPSPRSDEPDGDDLRRLVRHGWLDRAVASTAEVGALEAAVHAAAQPRLVEAWAGEHLAVESREDAWGRRTWVLRRPTGAVLVAPAPVPHWYPAERFADALLRIALPRGADPDRTTDADLAAADIGLFIGQREIAGWSRSGGWREHPTAWRESLPSSTGGRDLVPGYLPPHLAVADAQGDLRLLITAGGALRAPTGAADDAERFLGEAAAQLPDAAHLALVGQVFFRYVFDSPDPAAPLLPGTAELHGDLHQTSAATLATATGGVCRGDCDDLAELLAEIAGRQGRNALVMSLPAHLACAWAELREGRWHVDVLQTGPALEFVAETLPAALEAAYRRFDRDRAFDPAQVSVALRFAGENTRSTWRLGWRIFADAAYARTMIAVQRDWHFRTYLHGIRTMEALVAAGDEDVANLSELAGLNRRTGRWDDALRWMRRCRTATSGATAQLLRTTEEVQLLSTARRHREAGELARRCAVDELPAAAADLKGRLPLQVLRLAGALDSPANAALRLELLTRHVAPEVARIQPSVRGWLLRSFDQQAWERHPDLRRYRQLAGGLATGIADAVRDGGIGLLAGNPEAAMAAHLAEEWLAIAALRPDDETDDDAWRWSAAADLSAALLGDRIYAELVEAAPWSAASGRPEDRRGDGLPQLLLDLPSVRSSPVFWWILAHRALGDPGETGDPPRARRCLALALEAEARLRAARHGSPRLESLAVQARVLDALLARNRPALDAALAEVARRNDRALLEAAAGLIGRQAVRCDEAWFGESLASWRTRVDAKPFWFHIAWTAAVAGAPSHAVMAARAAADRFADDPTFAEEATFLAEVAQPPAR